jgi:hypothetical protein
MKLNYTPVEMQIILTSEEDVIRTSQVRLDAGEYGRHDGLEIVG